MCKCTVVLYRWTVTKLSLRLSFPLLCVSAPLFPEKKAEPKLSNTGFAEALAKTNMIFFSNSILSSKEIF